MGERWSINQYGGITRDGCFLAHNEIPITANADCDAYEARIAELEAERDTWIGNCGANDELFKDCMKTTDDLRAELASVKDESLRVVVGGPPCKIQDLESDMFLHEGRVYQIPSGEFYGVPLGHEGEHYTDFYGDSQTIVQPFTLERWGNSRMKFEISFEELMIVCVTFCVALVIIAITTATILGATGATP